MDSHVTNDLVAEAYVSWGLWVADCPRPGCLGAEHYGHAPITGVVGGLTQAGFRCARCGQVAAARWPDNADDIWWTLNQRPLLENRSWRIGETLEDLVVENVTHGVMPIVEDGPGVAIMDGRYSDRVLPAAAHLRIGA